VIRATAVAASCVPSSASERRGSPHRRAPPPATRHPRRRARAAPGQLGPGQDGLRHALPPGGEPFIITKQHRRFTEFADAGWDELAPLLRRCTPLPARPLPQLYSRTGFVHQYQLLSAAAIARTTGGNFRLVHRLFDQIARILEINGLHYHQRSRRNRPRIPRHRHPVTTSSPAAKVSAATRRSPRQPSCRHPRPGPDLHAYEECAAVAAEPQRHHGRRTGRRAARAPIPPVRRGQRRRHDGMTGQPGIGISRDHQPHAFSRRDPVVDLYRGPCNQRRCRKRDIGYLHALGGDPVLRVAKRHHMPACRDLDHPPGAVPVLLLALARHQRHAASRPAAHRSQHQCQPSQPCRTPLHPSWTPP
jgi:hypothetical protein